MDQNLRKRILDSLKMPKLCIERALIVTQSHKETEGEPMIIRRAKALHELANKMPITIENWQIIVGNYSSEPFAVSPTPEGCWKTVLSELDDFSIREGDKYLISEEDKKTLREVLPWWRGKSIEDTITNILPPDILDAFNVGLLSTGFFTQGTGNFAADYKKVISRGFFDIMEEIKGRIKNLDLSIPEDYDKWIFYEAALISCDSVIDYAQRYAKLARKQAAQESLEKRKKELLLIAKNCEKVPKYPATNFSEAIQAFWFTHLLLHFESTGGTGIVAGRLDQTLYPFIKDTDKSEIKKWLENLWINYNQIMRFLPARTASIWSGHPISEQPSIGGMNEKGQDMSNELTEMMLEVDKEVALPQPDIALLYHDKLNKNILHKICETLPITMKPKIFNYNVMIKHALERGVIKKDLKDLVVVGCVATGPEGKFWGNNAVSFLNLGKVLELALNNGIDPLTEIKIGLESDCNPKNYTSFKQVLDAFKKQLKDAIRKAVILGNTVEKVHSELNPQPLASVLINDCLEKGLSVWESGAARYSTQGLEAVGLANVADSLAAIKKLVFEDNIINMFELLNALHSNFEGEWEAVRKKLINDAPKFGNDDDYVDKMAAEIALFYCNELKKYKSKRGSYCPSLTSVSAHVGLGKKVGALPDGRKAKEPLADGMSPSQGVCSKGPTAIIKSVTKIDHVAANGGTLLNMKFNTTIFSSPLNKEKFIQLLETYMSLGGFHVQFNIIDTKTLKDAQKYPEKYPYLLVRVAAYVSQFGQLPKKLQDDIITRSELYI